MKKGLGFLYASILVVGLTGTSWALSPALPPLPASLIGHWFNTEENDTVGLIVNADKTCELYTSRLTSPTPRSSRACKVEFYADKTYFIYLKGADGVCSTEADFEFRYLEDQARVDLQAGADSRFLLEKKPETAAKSDTAASPKSVAKPEAGAKAK